MLDYNFFVSLRAFPFGVILYDFLFLLVAIPIEAYIFNRRLKFDKRTSAFYAISINIFSNALGWIVFFLIEPTPVFNSYKLQVINYLLYNRLSDDVYSSVILVSFVTFFATLMVKFALLKILILSLTEPGDKKSETNSEIGSGLQRKTRRGSRFSWQSTSIFTTTLIANSLSYSAITLVVLFRVFALTDAAAL